MAEHIHIVSTQEITSYKYSFDAGREIKRSISELLLEAKANETQELVCTLSPVRARAHTHTHNRDHYEVKRVGMLVPL